MRIHIYTQELTKEVALVSKKADTGIEYYGVRWFIRSPDCLHFTPEDDDRSAITIWIPNVQSYSQQDLADVFKEMARIVEEAPKVEKN